MYFSIMDFCVVGVVLCEDSVSEIENSMFSSIVIVIFELNDEVISGDGENFLEKFFFSEIDEEVFLVDEINFVGDM